MNVDSKILINKMNEYYENLLHIKKNSKFIYIIDKIIEMKKLNIDFLNFLYYLLKINKVTLKYINYFKENLYSNNLHSDFKNLIKNIMETENFSQNISENICLYLFLLYLTRNVPYMSLFFNLTDNQKKEIKIPSYIYNYKICIETPDEDEKIFIHKDFVINNCLYEKLLDNLELLDVLSEDNPDIKNILNNIINIIS